MALGFDAGWPCNSKHPISVLEAQNESMHILHRWLGELYPPWAGRAHCACSQMHLCDNYVWAHSPSSIMNIISVVYHLWCSHYYYIMTMTTPCWQNSSSLHSLHSNPKPAWHHHNKQLAMVHSESDTHHDYLRWGGCKSMIDQVLQFLDNVFSSC